MNLPPEVRDAITLQLSDTCADPWFYGDCSYEYTDRKMARRCRNNPWFETKPDLKALLNLRLVSRDWHSTATQFLVDHFWWSLKFASDENLSRASQCALAQHPFLVKKLEITDLWNLLSFQRIYTYTTMPDHDDGSYASHHIIRDRPLKMPHNSQQQVHTDKSRALDLLRTVLNRLDGVQALSVEFPSAQSDEEYMDSVTDCYDTKYHDLVLSTIEYAINLDGFQHLVDLRLNIPCTRDMERFTNAMSVDLRHRLRHLRICIMDETGQDGSNSILNARDSYSDDGAVDGASDFETVAPSNLQIDFPNKENQRFVWEFISSCPNLESLGVTGSHYLDLDQLDWEKSPESRGLHRLCLSRVWASVSSILKLLEPSSPSKDSLPLRCINLHDVKVYKQGGNWSELFMYLRKNCPNLQASQIDQLTYWSTHESYDRIPRVWEDSNPIWTDSQEDLIKLGQLMKHLVEKAGGKEYYPHEYDELDQYYEEDDDRYVYSDDDN